MSRDPHTLLSNAYATWEMMLEQIANGLIKNTSKSNKNKKSTNDDGTPKEKTPYNLFGIWLKEQDESYKALKVSEFSSIQSQLWKGAEGDEWKQANNYIEPSKKTKKSTDDKSAPAAKPAKKTSDKPAKKQPSKPAKDDDDSDVELDDQDFEDASEVDE
jgi:hypothetical protein